MVSPPASLSGTTSGATFVLCLKSPCIKDHLDAGSIPSLPTDRALDALIGKPSARNLREITAQG
jgi:hypothetical protein